MSSALLGAKNFAAVVHALYFHLREDFAVPHVALRIWGNTLLDGTLEAAGSTIDTQRLGVFSRDGDALVVTAGDGGARFILLGGEPIGEPIVFHGPFAMNTAAEIRQAVTDLQAGAFGHLD